MKSKKLIFYVLVASVVVWLADSILDFVFEGDEKLLDLLILRIPVNVLYFRIFIIFVYVLFAIFIYYDFRLQNVFKKVNINIPEFIVDEERGDYKTIRKFFHSIRTQLNNIMGFTNLIYNESNTKDEIKVYLKYVESSKKALIQSVDSLVEEYRILKQPLKGITLPGTEKILDWKSKTILIAEDVEANYFLLNVILKKTGVNILWAKNGLEAVDMIRKGNNIDLVLMDILMPEMDGIDATMEIRKINPDLPVIAQTAYTFENNEMEKNIFKEYLVKPIWKYDLLQKCSKYFSQE